MRKTFKEVMNMLNVPKQLGPYETWPWSHYDEGLQESMSAEVRMGSEDNSVEAEIQIIRDEPKEGELPFECLLWVQVEERKPKEWRTKSMMFKGEPFGAEVFDWEQKSLKVFARCVVLLNQMTVMVPRVGPAVVKRRLFVLTHCLICVKMAVGSRALFFDILEIKPS